MIKPENVPKRLRLAAELIKQGQTKQAEAILQDLIKSAPDNPDVWYLASVNSRDPAQQIQRVERALQLQPDHPQATRRLAKLRITERLGSAPPRTPTTDRPKQPTSPRQPQKAANRGQSAPQAAANKQQKPRRSGFVLPAILAGILGIAAAALLLIRSGIITLPESSSSILNQTASLLTGQQISGERIAFFDRETMLFINPDAINQTLMYKSNDFSFNNNRGLWFTWSPDGAHFAFTNRERFSDFTLVHEPSGQISRLLGSGVQPSWSPDSSQVVMAWSDSRDEATHLALVNADGSNPRSLTPDDTIPEYDPAWSPDGQRIVFVRRESEQEILYTIKPDSSDETRLTTGSLPQWSPDSRVVTFTREKNVYRINADGSGETEIIVLPERTNDTITYKWSPDSQKIAYVMNGRLSVMNADGTAILWVSPPFNRMENFVWSPDSQRILGLFGGDFHLIDLNSGTTQLFIASRANESRAINRFFASAFAWLNDTQIRGVNRALEAGQAIRQQYKPAQPLYFADSIKPLAVYRFDGESVERLVAPHTDGEPEMTSTSANWSPDGTQIAVSYHNGETRTDELYLLNADGSNLRLLTPNGFDAQWSPDGKRIGFLSGRFDNAYLYVIDAAGGEPVQVIAEEMSDQTWNWSPDSQQIVYSMNGAIIVINADGTNPHMLARGGMPDWSPDGKHIVFAGLSSDNHCICIVPADGSAAYISLGVSGDDPMWSPDGKRIVFEYGFEIYTVNADGSDVRRLTHSDGWKRHPSWSPDGLYIAYWLDASTFGYDLNVMHADGTGQQSLQIHPIMGLADKPYWLPLALHANLSSFQAVADESTATPIPTVPSLGANTAVQPTINPTLMTPAAFHVPTTTPFGGTERGGGTGQLFFSESSASYIRYFTVDLHNPALFHFLLPDGVHQAKMHPDGKHFVGTYQVNREPTIVLINRGDLAITPIPNIGRAFDFALSPDGSRVAYLTDDPNTHLRQIWVANIDGTNIRQLTQHGDTSFQPNSPDWSPDGKSLAYSYYSSISTSSQIRVINVDTLSDDLLVEPGQAPAWSPDGQQIAYIAGAGYISNIYIVNADGSNAHPITSGESRNGSPVWSPNGQHIAFFRSNELLVMNADGSDQTRVAALPGGGSSFSNLDWEKVPDPSLATFTPAPTITPSSTPTATPTATVLPPTWTPNPASLFKFTPTTGRASAALKASPPDNFLVVGYTDAEGNISLEGRTQLEEMIGGISFILWLGDDVTSDFWSFGFYAPDMEVGRTYAVETRFGLRNEANLPAMRITSPGRGCSYILGDFVIEQAEPEIVISFTHYCEQDTTQELKGRIIFTP